MTTSESDLDYIEVSNASPLDEDDSEVESKEIRGLVEPDLADDDKRVGAKTLIINV